MKLHIIKFTVFLSSLSFLFLGCNRNEVSEIILNENFQYLGVNDVVTLTGVLKAPEDNNYTLQWHTSDESVAVVSKNGMVTAISEGSAVITAMAGNKSASCNVHVATYKFNGAEIYYDPENSLFYLSLFRNNSIYIEDAEIPDGNVLFLIELYAEQNATSIVNGDYEAVSKENFLPYTFLKGELNSQNQINGSYIEDRFVYNNKFLISQGRIKVASQGDRYVISGNNIIVNDLTGNKEELSFVYTGNIPVKNDPKEIQ